MMLLLNQIVAIEIISFLFDLRRLLLFILISLCIQYCDIYMIDGDIFFLHVRIYISREAKVKLIYNSIYFTIWQCGNGCIFLEEIKRIRHKNVSFCMPLKFHTFSYGISQNVTYLYTMCLCVVVVAVFVQRNGNAIKVIVFENEPYHSVSCSFIFSVFFVRPILFPSDNLTLCLFSCNNTFVSRVYTKIKNMKIVSIYKHS